MCSGILVVKSRRDHIIAFLLTALIVAVLGNSFWGPANADPAITEIRESYQICRALRTDKVFMRKMYGVYTDLENQDRAIWSTSPPSQGMVLEEVVLYGPGGSTQFAELLETTPSGDWSKATEYCYRADGSLAFIFSELRTFYGDARVEDRLYFDRSGEKIHTIRRIFDLNSGQRLPDGTANFSDRETRIYLTTVALTNELSND